MKENFRKLLRSRGTKIHLDKQVCLNISMDSPGADCCYLLEDGICALTGVTSNGEETVYLYFYPPRIVGFNQLLMTHGTSHPVEFSIITKTKCTLYRISFSAFQDLMQHNPAFNTFLIQTLSNNYYEVLVHFHQRLDESAVTGLSRLLLNVAKEKDGILTVPKFFTYAELARYLGTHPVTVSRIMAKMKQRGYLSKNSNGILIENVEALRQIVYGNGELCLNY